MFDIKNLGVKEWIIIGLLVLIIGLGYKIYTSQSQIKQLGEEIETLKKKINSTAKLLDDKVDNSLKSESDSESVYESEPTNYKTNKTIETFNNNKNVECDDETCWISNKSNLVNKSNLINQSNPVNQSNIINQSNPVNHIAESKNLQYVQPTQHLYSNQNPYTNQSQYSYQSKQFDQTKQLEPVTQENIDEMKDITSFLTMANNMVEEVDRIMDNDICIPIDFKKIVDQIYESPETATNNDPKFNPVIIDDNDVIEVKPDQINSKLDIHSVPDFINIPETFDAIINDINNEDNIDSPEKQNPINVEESIQEPIDPKSEQEVLSEASISDKYKTMKINDIKNLAKGLNIKLTEHGRPKNKEQLIAEINKCQSVNSQKNI